MLLGASTGRDGIGGASVLASASFDAASDAKRPAVQVGDPFEEKKLIEACLELYDKDLVVGVQDLGAAGLSCATAEPAARAKRGIDVQLDRVHVREPGMTAAELLMSESQERMMAFVEPERLNDVLAVARRWEIDAAVVGQVSAGPVLRVFHHGELVAELPAASLSEGAPLYRRPGGEPWWLEDLWTNTVRYMRPPDIGRSLLSLLAHPSIADASWVYRQYDHMLFLNTVVEPGHDATLLRIRGTDKGLAVSTDGNGRLCYLDPRRGAARLVYEAALNVATAGARPLAVVDNLNFGNPEKTEVMWQFAETIDGLTEACSVLGIPVIGGNVSFYNETGDQDIYPTPVVGMLGKAEPIPPSPPRLDRATAGMELWLLGPPDPINLAGSTFEKVVFGHVGGRPAAPDATAARSAVELAVAMVAASAAPVLHDVSDGGLAVAVAEVCIRSGVGATVKFSDWRHLFSEDPHRLIAAIPPQQAEAVARLAGEAGVPAARIGEFGGDRLVFSSAAGPGATVPLAEAADTWRDAIPGLMEGTPAEAAI